jgi:hypothetical protein
MSSPEGQTSQNPAPPPVPIASAPTWVNVLGAIFGGTTLLAFFVFAFVSGKDPAFACNAFTMLAAAFAFGAALAASFIGGAAAINGSLGSAARNNAILFSAGGGIAVLFIAFWAFHYFKDDRCPLLSDIEKYKQQEKVDKGSINSLTVSLSTTKEEYESKTSLLKQQYEGELGTLRENSARRITELRNQDIVIVVTSSQPDLSRIIVQYTDGEGETKRAIRQKNVFKIPRVDMHSADPGIFISYDPTLLPPQRQNNPPPISIERIDHQFEPLRLQLFLNFPKLTELTQ